MSEIKLEISLSRVATIVVKDFCFIAKTVIYNKKNNTLLITGMNE